MHGQRVSSKRGELVVPVALVQVDVVGLQALQTLMTLVEDLLSRQPTVVGRRERVVRQRPEQFGGQHVGLAGRRQSLADRQLRVTVVVLVGGVVEIDAQLPRLAVEVVALILLLGGEDQPRSRPTRESTSPVSPRWSYRIENQPVKVGTLR